VLAIQIFTPPKRLVLYFLLAQIKRENICEWHKSQEETCSKKVQHHLSFLNKEGNPRKTPCSANFVNETTTSFVNLKKERKRERGETPCPLPIKYECVLHGGEEGGEGVKIGGSFTLCLS
jgi:hypothetical protein